MVLGEPRLRAALACTWQRSRGGHRTEEQREWEHVCLQRGRRREQAGVQGEASDEKVQILGAPEGQVSYDLIAQIWGPLRGQ